MSKERAESLKKSQIAFLFYHYGEIPTYLLRSIEHVRIFNPDSQIYLVADGVKSTLNVQRFGVITSSVDDYHSDMLARFDESYRHLSSYNEKYEKFCFRRWFVSETIRKIDPNKIYVLMDSDVAVFGDVGNIIADLPQCPISLSGCSPHFSFIRGSIEPFLDYILSFYADQKRFADANELHQTSRGTGNAYNLTDNTFLPLFMRESIEVQNYNEDLSGCYIDQNIHLTEGFEYLQLRRRPRKKIFWRIEEGRAIPYFKRGNEFVKALALHFQGPGKRVFHRFNSMDGPPSPIQIWWWNQIFQKRWLANLM